jgi:plasmid stabilization system protein ParE
MLKNKYTLKLTAKAEHELNRIYDYISKDLDSEIAAINFIRLEKFSIFFAVQLEMSF